MKWAPNKRLHFEVAVIKAIQTLSQVTLNEVIENLAALRDGKEATHLPKSSSSPPRSLPPASPRPATSETARVAETPEKNNAPSESQSATPEDIWQRVTTKIPSKGFLRMLVDSVTVLGADGRNFLLGYAPDQKSEIETLASASNRRVLELALKEISGRDWTLKLIGKEGLPKKQSGAALEAESKQQEKAPAFKDDPLIQEALEIFKGEIKTAKN